ncbi:MAG: TIR domain-containing protein [Rhodospirillaceae bacterium]|nr:TIR domain-containing protein [Rhodospirillaceae bacterium]
MSHNHQDKVRFVDGFVQQLRTCGMQVRYDSLELLPGDVVPEWIFDALGESDVFIVVLSDNAPVEGWVKHEIFTALLKHHRGKCRIITVLLDGVKVPDWLKVFQYQHISNLSDYDEELTKIVAGINRRESESATEPFRGLVVEPALKRTVPCTLPVPPQKFVNRKSELDELDAVLQRVADTPGSGVAVVHGMPGVGKTALAGLWANKVRDRFPGGSLYVDLGPGGGSGALPDFDDIMVLLLGELGAEKSSISPDRASRQKAYYRLTDSRQMLLFADNVTEYAQIRQIRPRSDGSLVIAAVSKHSKEFDLEVAESVELRPLERSHAVAMLRGLAGARRDDPRADLLALAELCGDLPIALTVAAAHLRRHSAWTVTDFLERIGSADDRLEAITGDHGKFLTRVFDEVCDSFDAGLGQFYRRLGLFPGVSFTEASAAAVADVPVVDAGSHIEELFDFGLVVESRPNRYQVHALVAEHMRRAFHASESHWTERRLVGSLVDWYRRAVMCADVAVSKERLRLAPRPATGPVDVPVFGSSADAQLWYVEERHNIVSVMRLASSYGMHEPVWHMAEAMWLLYTLSNFYGDWEQSAQLGIDAAVACGDPQAEARLRPLLAKVFAVSGRYEEAGVQLAAARRGADESGNRNLQAMVTEFEGSCALLAGDKERALDALLSTRVQAEQLGSARAVAVADLQLSRFYLAVDDHVNALGVSRQARAVFESVDDPMNIAKTTLMAGQALLGLGRLSAAAAEAVAAVELCREQGMAYHSAESHETAADAFLRLRQVAKAVAHAEDAVRLYSGIGHEKAELVAEKLARMVQI